MKIKTRNQILTDIIRDGKKYPQGWNAAIGRDETSLSHDYYIFHPNIGIYLLKEYSKNPFEVRGLGSKIARHIDEDIEQRLMKTSSDFGIIQGDVRKILRNITKGVPPQKILQSALSSGKDLGIKIPVWGQASTSHDTFHSLNTLFSASQQHLTASFEKMVAEDGVYTSYV